MADNTLIGVAAITAIVVVAALFFSLASPATPQAEQNIAGQAYTTGAQDAGDSCEPARFCDGSKLVIVREDCSTATAWCDNGCDKQALVCR